MTRTFEVIQGERHPQDPSVFRLFVKVNERPMLMGPFVAIGGYVSEERQEAELRAHYKDGNGFTRTATLYRGGPLVTIKLSRELTLIEHERTFGPPEPPA